MVFAQLTPEHADGNLVHGQALPATHRDTFDTPRPQGRHRPYLRRRRPLEGGRAALAPWAKTARRPRLFERACWLGVLERR
jgi:hypothetical protein